MQTVIIVIHLMIVLAMCGIVLLQRSEGGGLGIGSTGGFLSSRGTANVLTRTTAILAAAFFATSLLLSVLAGIERRPATVLQPGATPTAPTPGSAPTPLSPGGRGILDTLRGGEQAPAGPQVPQSQ
jgi:preprotein translocase subunit SecG